MATHRYPSRQYANDLVKPDDRPDRSLVAGDLPALAVTTLVGAHILSLSRIRGSKPLVTMQEIYRFFVVKRTLFVRCLAARRVLLRLAAFPLFCSKDRQGSP